MEKQKNKKAIYLEIIVFLSFLIILLNINVITANTPCPPGFPGDICDGTLTNFFLTNNENLFCENNGDNWVNWSTNSPVIVLNTTGIPTAGGTVNCYSPDGANDEYYCCPSGYSCVDSGGGFDLYNQPLHHCEYTGIFYCWNYEDETNCSNYDPDVAEDTVEFHIINPPNEDYCGSQIGDSWTEGSETCVNYSKCMCSWSDTEMMCGGKSELYKSCSGNPGPGSGPESTCTYINYEIVDECDITGKRIITWNITGTGIYEPQGSPGSYIYHDYCKPGSRTILCESMVKLGFFDNLFGIITVIIILIIIYYLNEQKKKNVNGRKKNKNLKEKKENKNVKKRKEKKGDKKKK